MRSFRIDFFSGFSLEVLGIGVSSCGVSTAASFVPKGTRRRTGTGVSGTGVEELDEEAGAEEFDGGMYTGVSSGEVVERKGEEVELDEVGGTCTGISSLGELAILTLLS